MVAARAVAEREQHVDGPLGRSSPSDSRIRLGAARALGGAELPGGVGVRDGSSHGWRAAVLGGEATAGAVGAGGMRAISLAGCRRTVTRRSARRLQRGRRAGGALTGTSVLGRRAAVASTERRAARRRIGCAHRVEDHAGGARGGAAWRAARRPPAASPRRDELGRQRRLMPRRPGARAVSARSARETRSRAALIEQPSRPATSS